ncbi:MAG: hypothetical protein JSR58_06585 [Verrucomicrobia bacterium]|nr:hypothetical protein [Verrucomicrobiota bacterium]
MRIAGFLLLFSTLWADSGHLKSLLSSLDPLSVSQHLAFYNLYSETPEGQKALKHAWHLLSGGKVSSTPLQLPSLDIQAIISLITRDSHLPPPVLSEEQLGAILSLASKLSNRFLPGHQVWTKQELLALPTEHVDLGRGLLLYQFDEDRGKIEQYEALLDLMALQILARLPSTATSYDKIREINRFIFEEMHFRFPPHSLYAKEIDLYTFLPSVLDSREGVCLGVSILYLSIAQRIDLPLEIITPPGHIFVRYREGLRVTNIETTARGIHLPSEVYLGIETRRLAQRTMKEVIGMAFVNEASVAWTQEKYDKSVELYLKAAPFLPDDPLHKFLLGLNYLFLGKKSEAKKLLKPLQKFTYDHAVSAETIPDDYFAGRINADGIKAVFQHVDSNRASIVKKQKELLETLRRYPRFRAGLFHLAITYLQLGRMTEAKDILEKYHALDPNNASVEYYLAISSLERYDYLSAWKYLYKTEELLTAREHKCRALRGLKDHLRRLCPPSAAPN